MKASQLLLFVCMVALVTAPVYASDFSFGTTARSVGMGGAGLALGDNSGATKEDILVSTYTVSDRIGDGVQDNTSAIQAALDSGASVIYLPTPPKHYLISKTLVIHSDQTLRVDPNAVIRLADNAKAHILTNADHEAGNRRISIIGGIWDGNNLHQTCDYHEGVNCEVPYDPARYLGLLMQFNNVEDLRIAHCTLKDPEMFGVQLGNVRRFTVDDITFDYNQERLNMDGIHVNGNCHQGRISNLKGTLNDDMVALNADEPDMYKISRGSISDIQVDGLWTENGWTAVRLLSAGLPVQRIRISNIFGSFRYHVVSFTHHSSHPGEPSTFEDIVIDGVFCSKPTAPIRKSAPTDHAAVHSFPFIWFEGKTSTSNVHIQNVCRQERLENAPPFVMVSKEAKVGYMSIRDACVINKAPSPLDFLVNEGAIDVLHMSNVYVKAEGGEPRGNLIIDRGTISNNQTNNIMVENMR